jgi:hypothetical protein
VRVSRYSFAVGDCGRQSALGNGGESPRNLKFEMEGSGQAQPAAERRRERIRAQKARVSGQGQLLQARNTLIS